MHPLFYLARIPLFIIYSFLTCCCNKGNEISDDNPLEDAILNFDYIAYQEGELIRLGVNEGPFADPRYEVDVRRQHGIVRQEMQE